MEYCCGLLVRPPNLEALAVMRPLGACGPEAICFPNLGDLSAKTKEPRPKWATQQILFIIFFGHTVLKGFLEQSQYPYLPLLLA